jgi:cysteine desulfuration protein SufE
MLMQYDDLTQVSLVQLEHAQNWQAKYRLITDWGKLISNKPAIREPQYLVKGCEALAWLAHYYDGTYHRFAFDSESRVINGLVALLLSVIDKKTTSELVQINVKDILRDMGLEKHITPSRNNGFKTIVERAFYLAISASQV